MPVYIFVDPVGVRRYGRCAVFDQMALVAAQVLDGGRRR